MEELCYNICKYMELLNGGTHMNLFELSNTYLSTRNHSKRYDLTQKVENYIYYISKSPFFVEPPLTSIESNIEQTNPNSAKFLLFSAPGATGKSTFAKYLSHETNAIYWDLSKIKIGDNSFTGSLTRAVKPENYSCLIADLKNGDVTLVIDALDEADIISGRRMLGCFIKEINESLEGAVSFNVILFARTSTAQFIASLCAESKIALKHFEIGFFDVKCKSKRNKVDKNVAITFTQSQ